MVPVRIGANPGRTGSLDRYQRLADAAVNRNAAIS